MQRRPIPRMGRRHLCAQAATLSQLVASLVLNLVMFGILRLMNRAFTLDQLQATNHAIVRDESHNFRLKTYYVRPEAQLQQLDPNFSEIKVYSWRTGWPITDTEELRSNADMWLYYLCVIK